MKGRLAFKLTEETSPNPRWLVKFDGQTYKDEEVYERSFGKLLHSVEDDDALTPPLPPAGSSRRAPALTTNTKLSSGNARTKVVVATATTGKDSNKSVNGTSSEENNEADKSPDQKTNKNGNGQKTVSFSESPVASDDSSALEEGNGGSGGRRGRGGKISAREARSLRRQAKIDDRDAVSAVMAVTQATSGIIGLSTKRRLPPKGGHHKSKRPRVEGHEEVIKVKMLTGTLYLYRGLHRRAEFIRRV